MAELPIVANDDRCAYRRLLFWIVAAAALLRLIGLGWGLPASDGWDSDGIAPRDFLGGLILTFTPGSYFTYPPLHLALLAVLTLPGWIAALLHAPTLAQSDVVHEILKIPYMTFFAVVARLVSVAMSLGTILCIARMTRLIAGNTAALFATAACALDVVFLYYSQTTNLDVPYLFWSALSILAWMEAIAKHQPRRITNGILFAAAAVATKDQAYALFLPSFPVILIAWFALDPWPRLHARAILVRVAVSGVSGAFVVLLIDGAFFNPSGFAKRIVFLSGTASSDNGNYSADWAGYLRIVFDIARSLVEHYPLVLLALGLFGAAVHARRFGRGRPEWVAGLLPLMAILSFTMTFNWVALRTDDRFLLPHSLFLAVYVGIGAAQLISVSSLTMRRFGAALLAVSYGFALFKCLALDAAFANDPRYDAERWLAGYVRASDTIETYGQNVYLPRFPTTGHLTRVAPQPAAGRNPLLDAEELDRPFEDIERRSPRFIVVSKVWVQRYLMKDSDGVGRGRAYSTVQQQLFLETGARAYFADLIAGRLAYHLAYQASYQSSVWPIIHIHQSLAEDIMIFERNASPAS